MHSKTVVQSKPQQQLVNKTKGHDRAHTISEPCFTNTISCDPDDFASTESLSLGT